MQSIIQRLRSWKTIGGLSLLLLVLGLSFGLLSQRSSQPVAAQDNDVVSAFIGDLSASASASGQVEASRSAQLTLERSGVVTEIYVHEGDVVPAGTPLLQLDTTDLAIQVDRAEQALALQQINLEALETGARPEEIATAEANLASAQATLDTLLAGPSEHEIAESEANLQVNQAEVASASASYSATLDSVSETAVAQARINLANAQQAYNTAVDINERYATGDNHEAMLAAADNLTIAQQALDELLAGPAQGNLDSAAGSLSAASANLNGAQAQHTDLLAGPSAQTIATAEANVARAAANLANLRTPASEAELAIAAEEVRQAELNLQDAEAALADATLRAPFDGHVTALYVAVGETAVGSLLELASPQLQVTLAVDELDIGEIAVGQNATLTLESWPDELLSGTVSRIAPSANQESAAVTFDVTIELDESNLPVRSGMTANAQLTTANLSDLLLVPSQALTADRSANLYTVERVTGWEDGQPLTETVAVTIGFRDQHYTQITAGLEAGDELILPQLAAPVEQFQPPRP